MHSIVLIFMPNSNRWSSHAWRIVVYGLKVHIVVVVTKFFFFLIYKSHNLGSEIIVTFFPFAPSFWRFLRSTVTKSYKIYFSSYSGL